jgi:hypothetical protein
MLPSDDDGVDVRGDIHPEYEVLRRFEPRDAKRILSRLEEEHLSFEVRDCSEIRPDCPRYRRRNWSTIPKAASGSLACARLPRASAFIMKLAT